MTPAVRVSTLAESKDPRPIRASLGMRKDIAPRTTAKTTISILTFFRNLQRSNGCGSFAGAGVLVFFIFYSLFACLITMLTFPIIKTTPGENIDYDHLLKGIEPVKHLVICAAEQFKTGHLLVREIGDIGCLGNISGEQLFDVIDNLAIAANRQ